MVATLFARALIMASSVIVTSGAAFWGPPVRTTGYSEIVIIELIICDR
ncbi:MAG: hypothetical protein KJ607_06150 [Bacteroidetes bacterium]|nr:hypothetical protein [Bacteroidota bacterium]